MLAEPDASAVTSPLEFTVAMAVLSLDQAINRPVSSLPDPSTSVTVSCSVPPLGIAAVAGKIVTEATAVPLESFAVMVSVQDTEGSASSATNWMIRDVDLSPDFLMFPTTL